MLYFSPVNKVHVLARSSSTVVGKVTALIKPSCGGLSEAGQRSDSRPSLGGQKSAARWHLQPPRGCHGSPGPAVSAGPALARLRPHRGPHLPTGLSPGPLWGGPSRQQSRETRRSRPRGGGRAACSSGSELWPPEALVASVLPQRLPQAPQGVTRVPPGSGNRQLWVPRDTASGHAGAPSRGQ